MKVASLFIAVIALSSCVAKPWMVGSVNDHYGPPHLKHSKLLESSNTTTVTVETESSVHTPVGKTGIHPGK